MDKLLEPAMTVNVEVTKYLTITNHAYPEFILAMNENLFKNWLGTAKIVTDAANEVRDELRKNAKAEDMVALEKLKKKVCRRCSY